MAREGEKRRRYDERLSSSLEELQSVADNKVVPRNIRRMAKDSIAMLRNRELSVAVRAANTVSMLEEIALDYNTPSFVRVTIWSAMSKLESVKE